jgi:hypothetical protein
MIPSRDASRWIARIMNRVYGSYMKKAAQTCANATRCCKILSHKFSEEFRKWWNESDKQSCWDDPNRRAMSAMEWNKLLARDIKRRILQPEKRRELKNDALKLLEAVEDMITWSEYEDGDDWVDAHVGNLKKKVWG